MRLVVLSNIFPTQLQPFLGKFVKDQVKLLADSPGLDIQLVVPTPFSIPFTKRKEKNSSPLLLNQIKNDRVYYLSFPGKRLPKFMIKSFESSITHFLEKNSGADLIHIHSIYPGALCIPGLKQKGYKCILTIHGSDWYNNIAIPKLKPAIIQCLKETDLILAVGSGLKKDISDEIPSVKGKTEVVYNFIDEDFFQIPTADQVSNSRTKLNWDHKKTHALTVASLRHEKGVDLLVEAIHSNKQKNAETNRTHYHVVGLDEGSAYSQEIRKKALTLENITFHPPVPPQELLHYYYASDLLISCSRREGFGLALIEAAATGLPLVATPAGVATEFVDQTTGILCGEINVSSLADSVKEVTLRLDEFSEEEIRKQAVSRFGKSVFRERILNYYNRTLSQ